MNPFYELSESQKRQLIDAEMLFCALEQAEADAIRHRGSMFWREQDGGRYLIALSAHSRQRSLGPASPENEFGSCQGRCRQKGINQAAFWMV